MKRIAILMLAGLLTGGFLTAQGVKNGPGPGPDNNRPVPTTVTVEGKLVFLNGYICVVTPAKTYIVRMPAFVYGFVDGLKEGAQVKLEGRERPLPVPQATSHLMVTKLIFNGKEYDLTKAEHEGFMQMRWGMHKRDQDGPRHPMMQADQD